MRILTSIVVLAVCGWAAARAQDAGHAPVRTAEVGLFLVHITDLDQATGTFTAEFDVVSRWRDPARAWDVPPGAPDRRVFLDGAAEDELRRGWWPALHAVNGVGGLQRGIQHLTVRADGTVTNRGRLRVTLRAPLDFRAFPFDRQDLPVHVESALEPADRLHLAVAADFTGLAADFTLPEWRVEGLTAGAAVVQRVQERQPYARVTFHIGLARQAGFYVWKIMLPLAVIVMISWIVFWMSDEGLGRRAGVSATGMLTVIAYQFVVSGSLPRFPYLTQMDKLSLTALVSIAATMLMNLLVSRREPAARLRLDRTCRVVFPLAFVVAATTVLLS